MDTQQTPEQITKAAKLSVNVIEYEKIGGQEQITNEIKEDKIIEVQTFQHDKTCEVTVSLGATIPMAQYASARIDVTLSVPSYLEQVEEAYQFASKFVHAKILEQRNKLPTKK